MLKQLLPQLPLDLTGRITGQPEVNPWPEVGIWEVIAVAHEGQLGTDPTDENLLSRQLTEVVRKSTSRNLENLHSFALAERALRRYFSIWTARPCG
jgi:hypothetical protein